MKKYFLKGVDEPLEFGDDLSFDFVKEGNEGQSITKHVNCKFIPELVDLLLEEDVIEEKEVEEKKPETIDFSGDGDPDEDDTCPLEDVIDNLITLEEDTRKRLVELEKKVNKLEKGNIPDTGGEYVNLKDYIKRNKDIFKPLRNWVYTGNPTGATVEMFGFAI